MESALQNLNVTQKGVKTLHPNYHVSQNLRGHMKWGGQFFKEKNQRAACENTLFFLIFFKGVVIFVQKWGGVNNMPPTFG